MNATTAKFLVEAADERDIKAEIYDGYSGRGMFGAQTTGVVTDEPLKVLGAAVLLMIVAGEGLTDKEEQELEDLLDLRSDSMGGDTILY